MRLGGVARGAGCGRARAGRARTGGRASAPCRACRGSPGSPGLSRAAGRGWRSPASIRRAAAGSRRAAAAPPRGPAPPSARPRARRRRPACAPPCRGRARGCSGSLRRPRGEAGRPAPRGTARRPSRSLRAARTARRGSSVPPSSAAPAPGSAGTRRRRPPAGPASAAAPRARRRRPHRRMQRTASERASLPPARASGPWQPGPSRPGARSRRSASRCYSGSARPRRHPYPAPARIWQPHPFTWRCDRCSCVLRACSCRSPSPRCICSAARRTPPIHRRPAAPSASRAISSWTQPGSPLVFRGVSLSDPDKLQKEGQWTTRTFEELKAWGANVVRLPVHPVAWRARGEKGYLALLDEGVRWARELGLYVLLDWHVIGNLRTELCRTRCTTPRARRRSSSGARSSSHYADDPTVVLYELFNEPTDYNGRLGAADAGRSGSRSSRRSSASCARTTPPRSSSWPGSTGRTSCAG